MKSIISRIILLAVLALGFAAHGKHSEFYGQRASLFELLPVDSTSVVFLGNSITNGCEWHELLGMPNALNRGISGDIVEGIEDRLAPVTEGRPAKIFLMVGVNDVSHHLSADSIARATVALVSHLRQATPTTEVYVQSLLPINMSFGRYKNLTDSEQTIRDINAMVEPQIEALGATWINLYPLFADDDGNLRRELTNDGLHLLGPAYLIWRDAILPYLAE